ncbi:MAG: hypothetical protein EZS28_045451, partial [Streblomastix strix]
EETQQQEDEEDDLILIALIAHLELEQVLYQNLLYQKIRKMIWGYNQPNVAWVGVGYFDCRLGVGVLFDFQESGGFIDQGVGPPICLQVRSGTTVFDVVAGTDSTGGHGATLNKLWLLPLQYVSTDRLSLL